MPEDKKESSWIDIPRYNSCFVCGEKNECGLNLSFRACADIVEARWTPREEHCGYKGVVHGGIVSAVLDEIMGWTGWLEYRKYYLTAELTVRFLSPTRAGEEYLARARLIKTGRKLYTAEGKISDSEGNIVAKGSGKFVVVEELERT